MKKITKPHLLAGPKILSSAKMGPSPIAGQARKEIFPSWASVKRDIISLGLCQKGYYLPGPLSKGIFSPWASVKREILTLGLCQKGYSLPGPLSKGIFSPWASLPRPLSKGFKVREYLARFVRAFTVLSWVR